MSILGVAAVIPFLPVVAKEIGINATALGIGFSMIPIFTFLSNPVIGFLVDYFQNIKHFLLILLITRSIAYASVLFLPTITYGDVDATFIRVSRFNESEALLNVSKPYEKSCLESILRNYTQCKLVFENENKKIYNNETSDLGNTNNTTYDLDLVENTNQTGVNTHWITFHINDIFLFEREDIVSRLNVECFPSIHQCSIKESHNILSAYQLWMFFILVVLASVTSTSGNSLTSVACYELLGTNTAAYGRQRLFGTIGWGIVCPLSGMLNDRFERSFISVIFFMAIFQIIDIMILRIIPIPKAHVSSDMSRDLRIIFTSKEILVFSSGIAIIGFLNALIYVFEFWFLEDLGASRTLLGLSIFMQCLVGEVPFLFFSGWFVSKLGHFLCFTCVFVGFIARLTFYFLLKDPWLVLPVDTLHGITFGLFHGAMADFAKEKAPKGMEATLLGFFFGLYQGLGM